jgi:hypothetical protein
MAEAMARPKPPVAPVRSAVFDRSSTAPTYRLLFGDGQQP